LSYDDEPKIGCVNHDCDKCKAVQEPTNIERHERNVQKFLAAQPAQPASEADMTVYKAIADNYHASLQPSPDYAWPTIEDYEKEVGFEVNDAFKAAWTMARTTNDLFKQMGENT